MNGLYDFRLSDVSINTLTAVLEAVASHKTDDILQIAKFAGLAKSTVSGALMNLQSLGLVNKNESNLYFCNVAQVRRGMPNDELRLYLKKALIAYRPFEAVCEGLALQESLIIAIRKASVLLDIPDGSEERFNLLEPVCKIREEEKRGNGNHGREISSAFLVTSGNTSELLKTIDKPLNDVAFAIV